LLGTLFSNFKNVVSRGQVELNKFNIKELENRLKSPSSKPWDKILSSSAGCPHIGDSLQELAEKQ
jgi:small-conductance mechanosensitive channel